MAGSWPCLVTGKGGSIETGLVTAAIWRAHGQHRDIRGQPHAQQKFTVRRSNRMVLTWGRTPAVNSGEGGPVATIYVAPACWGLKIWPSGVPPVYASTSGFDMGARDSNPAPHASTASALLATELSSLVSASLCHCTPPITDTRPEEDAGWGRRNRWKFYCHSYWPQVKDKAEDPCFQMLVLRTLFQATQCGPQFVYARLWGPSEVHSHGAQQARLWPPLATL